MNDAQSDMPPENHCPQCGAPLAPGALAGLCPACLLKQGAAADTITGAGTAPFTPPTVEELSAKFPQLEILSLIGKGGMGAVYKARQKQLDRFVALKILPPGIGRDPAFAGRFAREARALAKLSHPNIVTIHDFGQADGLFYLLMEFVDGMNLRQLLNTSRVSPREALAIVPQICDALQFAHDHGIVHRDIKPENILLDRLGRVKVADFGLAKLIGAEPEPAVGGGAALDLTGATEAGKIMGTPQYMAPEQRDTPGEVDHRADIYALGVVFYQMLTGELPGKRIEAPSKKVRIDVRLDEVVLRALEQKPDLRYQQASMFKTQVENIAADRTNANEPNQNGLAGKTAAHGGRSFTGLAWSLVPLVAVIPAFFNPWGARAWYYFAAGCAILSLLPSFGFTRRSGWSNPESAAGAGTGKPPGSPAMAYLSLGLLLAALLGTPLLLALARGADDAVAVFAAMALVLAVIFGIVSRSRLGYGVAIGCITMFIALGGFTWYRHSELTHRMIAMQAKMIREEQKAKEDAEKRAAARQTASPAPALAYGPEVNGLQAATELTPQDGRIPLGREIGMRYRIRNASDDDTVVTGRAFREDGGDSYIVEDAQGKRIPVNRSLVADLHTAVVWDVQSNVLESGETAAFKGAPLAFLPENTTPEMVQTPDLQYVLARPGRYTIRVRLRFPDYDNKPQDGVVVWKGEMETAPVTVEVGEPAPPAPVRINSAGAVFGPVIERELKDQEEAIDFDSSKPAGIPKSKENDIAQGVLDSVASLEHDGMDAVVSNSHTFLGLGMKVSAMKNESWENMTVQQLSDTLQSTSVKTSQKLNPGGDGPATYAFQTREGGRGILQVIAFTDTGVKLRYKLVQNPAPPAPDEHAVPVSVVNVIKGNIGTYLNALGSIAPSDVAKPAPLEPDAGKVLHDVIFTIPETDAQAVVSKLKAKEPPWVVAYDSKMKRVGEGRLSSVADKIDPATGTLQCNVVIVADQKTVLLPNTFLNIRMTVDDRLDVTVLPPGAVRENGQGKFVYFVKPNHTVTLRPVKTGGTDSGYIEITEGLSSGATVVLNPPDNLQEGASVSYKPEIRPDTNEIDFPPGKGADVVTAVANFVKAKNWAFKGGLDLHATTSSIDAVDAGGRHIVFKLTIVPPDKPDLLITADQDAEMSSTDIARQIMPQVDSPPRVERLNSAGSSPAPGNRP